MAMTCWLRSYKKKLKSPEEIQDFSFAWTLRSAVSLMPLYRCFSILYLNAAPAGLMAPGRDGHIPFKGLQENDRDTV